MSFWQIMFTAATAMVIVAIAAVSIGYSTPAQSGSLGPITVEEFNDRY